MSLRNFNNVTTVGSLSGPLASSGTTAAVSGFTNNPTAPFTVTIDRNQPTEEICLVSNVTGTTLTLVRGFDGTAAQAHSAGATVEHTAGAVEYSEANAHVNATTNVHGTTGNLVADQGSQTIFDKTFVSPVLQADVAAGDAAVGYVPPDASARNLYRGVGPDGTDKITVDSSGNIVSAGTAITTLVAAATSAATGNAIVKRNSTGGASLANVTINNTPAAASDAARKDYVDTGLAGKAATAHTHTSSQITDAASIATPSVQMKRDANGRSQVVDPAVAADIATKNYVDNATALVLGKMWGTSGLSTPISSGSVTVAFNQSRVSGGVSVASSQMTLPQDGFYELTYKGYANGGTAAVSWTVFRIRAATGDAACDEIQYHKPSAGSDEISTGSAIVPLKASDKLYLSMGVANISGSISYVVNSEPQGAIVQARYLGPLNGATPI